MRTKKTVDGKIEKRSKINSKRVQILNFRWHRASIATMNLLHLLHLMATKWSDSDDRVSKQDFDFVHKKLIVDSWSLPLSRSVPNFSARSAIDELILVVHRLAGDCNRRNILVIHFGLKLVNWTGRLMNLSIRHDCLWQFSITYTLCFSNSN